MFEKEEESKLLEISPGYYLLYHVKLFSFFCYPNCVHVPIPIVVCMLLGTSLRVSC